MEKMEKGEVCDVIIIGAGVSGASQLYALSHYTDIKNVALFDKEHWAGTVNSFPTQNSQTLHEGDIETNYNFEKAKAVKHKSSFTRKYVLKKKDQENKLFLRGSKMVLGVGDKEVEFLEKRFEEFKGLYPTLERLDRARIAEIEPKVVEGRDPNENIVGLYNEDGLTVNYSKLANNLINDSLEKVRDKDKNFQVFLGEGVIDVVRDKGCFVVVTERARYRTKFLSICAGAHSMFFAKKIKLDTVKDLSLLCVAGNFYYSPKYINTKIYTVQNPKLPFSAVHGDPDILNENKTRFGPTTRLVLMLERRKYRTIFDFFRVVKPFFGSIISYFKIMADKDFFFYALRHNISFQIPIYGTRLFVKEARKIIPTLEFDDIELARGQGGVRPQIVDTSNKVPLSLGEAKIREGNVLVNVTPSPGATTCIYNGIEDVEKMAEYLKREFRRDSVNKDFNL